MVSPACCAPAPPASSRPDEGLLGDIRSAEQYRHGHGRLLRALVWTALRREGDVTLWRRGRVRSCVRPVGAALMAAGPDAIRGPAPDQFVALWSARLSTECAGHRARPVCNHVVITLATPPAAAMAGGVSHGLMPRWPGLRAARGTIGAAPGQQGPDDPCRLVGGRHGGGLGRAPFPEPFEPTGLAGCFGSGMVPPARYHADAGTSDAMRSAAAASSARS
ncbi:MAG: hypothetical protein JWP20_2138 [Roseomonas sp.]|nr:hypothetical protein [Roseomonas sp.]